MEITTTMIESDYFGDHTDAIKCPGYYSFKRACKENLPWYQYYLVSCAWVVFKSASGKWRAFKNGEPVNMPIDTKIGDKITFKRGFKR